MNENTSKNTPDRLNLDQKKKPDSFTILPYGHKVLRYLYIPYKSKKN